jgi:hypothetical protein
VGGVVRADWPVGYSAGKIDVSMRI